MEEGLKFFIIVIAGSVGFTSLILSAEYKNNKPNKYRVYKTVGLFLLGVMVAMFIMQKNLWR